MSEEIYDVPRAVAFVADNEKALKILIETDLNILAKLIQGSDKVLQMLNIELQRQTIELDNETKSILSGDRRINLDQDW